MLSSQTPFIPAPAPASPPDPALPPDIPKDLADQVLNLYLGDQHRTGEIAGILGLPFGTIARILKTDYARAICALLQELDDRRAEILAGQHRIRALATTAELAHTAKREETRRLAAASLLRLVPYTPRLASSAAKPSSTGESTSPTARAERSLVSSISAALNRSFKADAQALAQEEAEFTRETNAILAAKAAAVNARAAATSAQPPDTISPSTAPPAAHPAHSPRPLERAAAASPALVDQLAARMAAPTASSSSPHPRSQPHPRARDSPRAA